MTMSLADLRAILHLSVSRLETFLQCPHKYALQYIECAERAIRPPSGRFVSPKPVAPTV
jgi:hypothetical protein